MVSHRVLLTGANGFIAQHILATFLEAGHSVRGVVRSQSKVDQLKRIFNKYVAANQLEFGIVPDMAAPGAFDEVLRSERPFDTVLHSASPFNYRLNTKVEEFLGPAIGGSTEVLRGIVRVAPTVKRVVLTGSMASVINFPAPKVTTPTKVYDESDWNPVTREQLDTPGVSPNLVYQASKKYAEKAAWDFVETEKPNFDVVVLNPPMVYGPLHDASIVTNPSELGESVFNIYNQTLAPGLTEDSPIRPTGLHLYVDVRDLAKTHLLAATTPAAGGNRFIVCAEQGSLTNQRIVNIARATLPEFRSHIPKGEPEKAIMDDWYTATSAKAKKVLGITFRTPEETIQDLAVQLAEVVKRTSA